jgi:hypothetical protein
MPRLPALSPLLTVALTAALLTACSSSSEPSAADFTGSWTLTYATFGGQSPGGTWTCAPTQSGILVLTAAPHDSLVGTLSDFLMSCSGPGVAPFDAGLDGIPPAVVGHHTGSQITFSVSGPDHQQAGHLRSNSLSGTATWQYGVPAHFEAGQLVTSVLLTTTWTAGR